MVEMQTLSDIIKNTRKQQQLTQAELAAAAGVGVRFIRELEQGKASCQIGKVLMVLKMLGLEVTVDGVAI